MIGLVAGEPSCILKTTDLNRAEFLAEEMKPFLSVAKLTLPSRCHERLLDDPAA